jgi:hypothetical protein
MRGLYRHRQIGWTIILISGLLAITAALAAFATHKQALLLPAGVLAVLGLLFSSLTIEVTESGLVWFFGPGVLRQRIARSEITKAAPARNKWWWGWGVHLTPRGWLYNVQGLEAVEIMRKNGRLFRLGTDEPQALASALGFESRERLAGEE